jgi:DNA-directed RNA polymerase subunit M/transcription elongation factor TFIIS
MSEVYARPEPTLIPIPRPLCPACQSRMMLIHVGASCDGPKLRIFECSRCGNVRKISMDDPMRSAR